ncbi:calcium-binding protein [Mesorhizobium sp. ZC-5]|uniref:calcium-binding protein n=1 Tax=Mesorhizobium sp. ZC-5 TaxID=2986066 RepID=UPI0021E84F81|nr:calcium-binding protein [Mesorhizobium sp. ZC-5]MCV3243102.1 hypothetical protein [Mesorhizobium sp. ZC-5]
MIKMVATGEILSITNHFGSTSTGIEQVLFADGTIWNREQVRQAAWFRGTSGNDSITGTTLDDTIVGGAGNDTMLGKAGSDTYHYTSEDGSDIINDDSSSTANVDTLSFSNLNADDLVFSRAGQNLTINVVATGERSRFNVNSIQQPRTGVSRRSYSQTARNGT